jgi:hypothetical protein
MMSKFKMQSKRKKIPCISCAVLKSTVGVVYGIKNTPCKLTTDYNCSGYTETIPSNFIKENLKELIKYIETR